MREQQLPGYALPHGLDTWSWPYSYVTVASLCFMVFIALKQLQGAVKATQVCYMRCLNVCIYCTQDSNICTHTAHD